MCGSGELVGREGDGKSEGEGEGKSEGEEEGDGKGDGEVEGEREIKMEEGEEEGEGEGCGHEGPMSIYYIMFSILKSRKLLSSIFCDSERKQIKMCVSII